MLIHLGIVLIFTVACVIFGLLRSDLHEENRESACEGCQDQDSCEHFSIVGFESTRSAGVDRCASHVSRF